MKIERIRIKNFRRLEQVGVEIEDRETIFVGPNNSGKTSATAIFKCFLGQQKFRIYDFSVGRIVDIDEFGGGGEELKLPAIELDLWFKIDPEGIEFGRAFTLVPNLSDAFNRVGVRLRYAASDASKLRDEYRAAFPQNGEDPPAKRLSEFLSDDTILNRHFETTYASLEETVDGEKESALEKDEGRNLLKNLVRVDFIEAQRGIDDEQGYRSNRLSSAFAGYYQKNLKQPEVAEEAYRVIDQNNQQLTEHYAKQFDDLMKVIKGLGVPSVNDRDLRIVSTLSPENALKGNTDLLYVDAERSHELPELYNGLGFKNLIYMAIQAKHFHSQWVRTPQNRPLCQIIFIEEPEVHLHAQVQQTFISNIWEVIQRSAVVEDSGELIPQIVVTTHSSHILDATEFGKVRYFRRCHLKGEDTSQIKVLNASEVLSLRAFQPRIVDIENQIATEPEILDFLKKYLRLTHCDLFFADAAILVEGSVEKLLMPSMIEKVACRLRSSYLTILEIGGAYAHRFDDLLSFLHIPYLIITDLDSVEPIGNHPVCRADTANALTSNASLKQLLQLNTVAELIALTPEKRRDAEGKRCIVFQQDVVVNEDSNSHTMRPRTLEEAFAYQNFGLLRKGEIYIGMTLPETLEDAYEAIYLHIKSSNFKKTNFAMDILASTANWQVPNYITEGLEWLEHRLHGPVEGK